MLDIQIGTMVMTKGPKGFKEVTIPGQVSGLVCDIHNLALEGKVFVRFQDYEGIFEYKVDEIIVLKTTLY